MPRAWRGVCPTASNSVLVSFFGFLNHPSPKTVGPPWSWALTRVLCRKFWDLTPWWFGSSWPSCLQLVLLLPQQYSGFPKPTRIFLHLRPGSPGFLHRIITSEFPFRCHLILSIPRGKGGQNLCLDSLPVRFKVEVLAHFVIFTYCCSFPLIYCFVFSTPHKV